eukprot:274361_1
MSLSGEMNWLHLVVIIVIYISKSLLINTIGWLCRHLLMKKYFKFSFIDIKKIESYRRLNHKLEFNNTYLDDNQNNIYSSGNEMISLNVNEEHNHDSDKNKNINYDEWTEDTLCNFQHKYGQNTLKNVDMLSRKIIGHIPSGLVIITVYEILGSSSLYEVLTYYIIFTFLWAIWYYIVIKYASNSKILNIMTFGANPRIRDGYLAYKNIIIAALASNVGQIIVIPLAMLIYGDPYNKDISNGYILLIQLVAMNYMFGDASGEIIGALFGKHTFNVKGMGEINKKSIEGCVAVFLFALISSFICILVNPMYNHRYWLYFYAFISSLLTVIVETISFRSTDNITIPTVNVIFYASVFRLYDIK